MVVIRSKEVSKYNVDKDTAKRTYNGIVFASVMEMRFYRDVVLPLKESGKIKKFELQKEYILQKEFVNRDGKKVRPITYVADFYLEYDDGSVVVIDTKGCPDNIAKMKKKMFWYIYPDLDYKWICYSKIDGGWVDYEYVAQQRKLRKKERNARKEKKEK